MLLGFESRHWLRQHSSGDMGYAAINLDTSKAYDLVKWVFLKHMMLQLNFDGR